MLRLLLLLATIAPGLTYKLIEKPGPFRIHVLDISPRWHSHLRVALSNDKIEGTEPLLPLAQRHRALAAINGGYFVVHREDGVPGDPAGLCVIDGRIVSENLNHRTCLILQPKLQIARVQCTMTLVAEDQSTRKLNGRNRALDKIRSGDGHDHTQLTHNEIIEYQPIFGQNTPRSGALEAVLVNGRVQTLRKPGGPIPPGTTVLQADREAADWLIKHRQIKVHTQLNAPATSLISGGPLLLKDGKIDIRAKQEGFTAKPGFLKRHPRTLAGITPNNHLLLVVVDGHDPKRSLGFTLEESARLLKELGCKDGLNLDGGGSSTMVIQNKIVNRPSDPSGPRSVGDAILITP